MKNQDFTYYRLRQVTSAIKQDGENQVDIIKSTAEKIAAIDFGKASTIRPKIVGETLKNISTDKDVLNAMFEILETEQILKNKSIIEIIPKGNEYLRQFGTMNHLYKQ